MFKDSLSYFLRAPGSSFGAFTPAGPRETAAPRVLDATSGARLSKNATGYPFNWRADSTQVVGVEVGGAVKNVLAIAAGMAEGLDLGTNARTALVTRALAEMRRLALALGGRASTILGLSGVGDTFGTCFGPLSRNRRLGERLGASRRWTRSWPSAARSQRASRRRWRSRSS